ncbi:MAG: hypothetical protein EAZ43_15445 [Betaproteobacteria bacterium]|nr:MAG: hypothetical protein EAZ43_15445 [Betaproteobacteria bacterium]
MRFQALALALSLLSFSAVAQVTSCPFNVDGTGTRADALRDGVHLMRYAQGLRGTALVAGTAGASPHISPSAQIEAKQAL